MTSKDWHQLLDEFVRPLKPGIDCPSCSVKRILDRCLKAVMSHLSSQETGGDAA